MSDYQVPRELKDRLIRENIEGHVAMGMTEVQARQLATEMFETAVKRAREEGTLDLPPGMGDQIFAKADSVPKFREMIDSRLREGATEEDCRWWWNLPELERQMLKLQDDAARLAVFKYEMDQGRTEEEAWQRVRKTFPIYGNPDEVTQESGDDRPLPYELKNRVNYWTTEAVAANPDEFKRRAQQFPTLNAFIRAEMRADRLPAALLRPQRVPPLFPSTTVAGEDSSNIDNMSALDFSALSDRVRRGEVMIGVDRSVARRFFMEMPIASIRLRYPELSAVYLYALKAIWLAPFPIILASLIIAILALRWYSLIGVPIVLLLQMTLFLLTPLSHRYAFPLCLSLGCWIGAYFLRGQGWTVALLVLMIPLPYWPARAAYNAATSALRSVALNHRDLFEELRASRAIDVVDLVR